MASCKASRRLEMRSTRRAFVSAMKRLRRTSTSAACVCSPPARRERRAVAASQRSARRPGLHAARSGAACGTSTAPRRLAERAGPAQRRRPQGRRGRAARPARGVGGVDLVGDPQAALLWVSRSQRHLASQLAERGYRVDHTVVERVLKDMGFSLKATPRPARAASIPIAMPSSSISMHVSPASDGPASRRSRSIPRKRS